MEIKMIQNYWFSLNENLPEENEIIWLYDSESNFVALGCLVFNEGKYNFAVSNGVIYAENNKIVSDCEIDDYNFTHWSKLPELPIK
jgi:hypothetical protein